MSEKKKQNANENLGLNPSHNGETEMKTIKFSSLSFKYTRAGFFMEIVILKVK